MAKVLNSEFAKELKSGYLKKKIVSDSMWTMIPVVNYSIDSPKGIERIKKHMTLFKFIDRYIPDGKYDFEPCMQDGRFVMIPKEFFHQGIGVTASNIPGLNHTHLDIVHHWYASDFRKSLSFMSANQICASNFQALPNDELAEYLKKYLIDEKSVPKDKRFCTFPFDPGHVVRLEGCFMDRKKESVEIIRKVLADASPAVKHNGDALINFIRNS